MVRDLRDWHSSLKSETKTGKSGVPVPLALSFEDGVLAGEDNDPMDFSTSVHLRERSERATLKSGSLRYVVRTEGEKAAPQKKG